MTIRTLATVARRPLCYPAAATLAALVCALAWLPFADGQQRAVLAVVAVLVVGYSAARLVTALGPVRWPATDDSAPDTTPSAGTARTVRARRVRQQHRLSSRSWLELIGGTAGTQGPRTIVWLPVYFDPVLVTLPESEITVGDTLQIGEARLYPAGRHRTHEPPGRLVDNPTRADPDHADPQLVAHGRRAARLRRRLLLDAQPAVAAPFIGLLWVYVAGGGTAAFVGATVVAAVTIVWLGAIGGSDPS